MFVVIRCVIRARNVNITEFKTKLSFGYVSASFFTRPLYCIKRLRPLRERLSKLAKLFHRNDTIIAIFFAANKNKGNANAALASSNS